MKGIQLFIVLLLALNLASCRKKKYPETVVENEPVFYTKFRINNVEYTLNGGIDDYRMFASYEQDASSVYNFIAEMKKASCEGVCANSLKIQINDFKPRGAGEPVEISQALDNGDYNFIMPVQEVDFRSAFNKTAKSYRWDFGDNSPVSTEANPRHSYTKPGRYIVSLTVTDSSGCMSTIKSSQRVGVFNGCSASIGTAAGSINNQIAFASFPKGGTPPYKSYHWNFGDGVTSILKDPVHVYKYSGSYPVSLMVVDSKNDTAYAQYNAVTLSDLSSCAANYTVAAINNQQSAITQALSQVVISWTDESGEVYRSNGSPQPMQSFFEISSVEDFDNNENGQRTKKLKVKFKCNLYSGGKTLVIDNAEAVICVAYK